MGRAIRHSLCLALWCEGAQVGLARVITDRATFAYLCDVYVLEAHRRQGLADWMIETLREHPDLQGLRHVAHTLKSSSASVGALQLSALCADIERMVRENQTDGLEARLDAMADEGGRVLAALSPNPSTAP